MTDRYFAKLGITPAELLVRQRVELPGAANARQGFARFFRLLLYALGADNETIMDKYAQQADVYLPGEKLFTPEGYELLERLYNAVPERYTPIHGDFHTHNIFQQDGELILIDMADTSTGHPLFKLGDIHVAFIVTAQKADEQRRNNYGKQFQVRNTYS